jgi:hypothetical protein
MLLEEVNNQYTSKCIELLAVLAVAVSSWWEEERERDGGGPKGFSR